MVEEKVFKDQFGDSLEVVKGKLNDGALFICQTEKGEVAVSAWLTNSQKRELIDFLSR